jgi:hypothetical protein
MLYETRKLEGLVTVQELLRHDSTSPSGAVVGPMRSQGARATIDSRLGSLDI